MTKDNSHIYLDYAAATPAAPEVVRAMEPYFRDSFGNTGSLHAFGQRAEGGLDTAREIIAQEIGADFREIIFTASATEANNMIIRGVAKKAGIEGARVVISTIEHESVFETADDIPGVEVVRVPVSREGVVDTEALRDALTDNTILVSVIFTSNVIGAMQPIADIAGIVKTFRKERGNAYPLFHTDAVQAFPFFKISVGELGVDALTLSGQKMYGPKGVGVLYIKEEHKSRVAPLITGGTQEFGFRAGTVNVPAIAGLAEAVRLVAGERDGERGRIGKLRDSFWKKLQEALPDIELNGGFTNRLPNNLHIYFPGRDGGELLIALDQAGVAVSTGSACSVRAAKPSPAVLALGYGEARARESIRFTLGYPTTEEEIEEAVERIKGVV